MTSTARSMPPVPDEFDENYISGGWRKLERVYGARTTLLLKWMEIRGRERLDALRREYMLKNECRKPARYGHI